MIREKISLLIAKKGIADWGGGGGVEVIFYLIEPRLQ